MRKKRKHNDVQVHKIGLEHSQAFSKKWLLVIFSSPDAGKVLREAFHILLIFIIWPRKKCTGRQKWVK